MKPILITGYVNPDLDAVACSLAYSEYLNKKGGCTLAAIIGEAHDEAKYILDRFKINYPVSILNANEFSEVILVDASDLNGLEGKIGAEKVIEIIDHRRVHQAKQFPYAKIQIELVGSVATLIAEKFIKDSVQISKQSALVLAGAIISNTLNFKSSLTTNRDKKAFQYLNKTAQLSNIFWRELFKAKSDLSGDKLKKRIEGDLAFFTFSNKKVGIAQLEIIELEKLTQEREGKIIKILQDLQSKMNFDFLLINAIELEKKFNYFISPDINTQKILTNIFPEIKFNHYLAKKEKLLMRKQIVPLLKEILE